MSRFFSSLPFLASATFLARKGSLLAALALVTASACSQAPADGDCDKLHQHLVEITINAGLASQKDRAKHKLELADSSRASFVERCESELKAHQVTCALKAKTKAELDACDA